MAVREDCRHYARRTTPTGERLESCRIGVNETDPFACPPDCLFFEVRAISSAGWQVPDAGDEPRDR